MWFNGNDAATAENEIHKTTTNRLNQGGSSGFDWFVKVIDIICKRL